MQRQFNKAFTSKTYHMQKIQDDLRSILIYMDSVRLTLTNIDDAMSMIKIARDKTKFVSAELTKLKDED